MTWVGGKPAGGSGQPPIRVTRDLVHSGYNLLHRRPASDTQSIIDADCNGAALCSTWSTPQQAADWAVRVLGETEIATCDDCETLRASAGTGLTPLIQETYHTSTCRRYRVCWMARSRSPPTAWPPRRVRC